MNYFSQKSVLVTSPGVEKRELSLLSTISSYITREVDAVLTTKEVKEWYAWSRKHWVYKLNEWENDIWNNDFCYISDENIHIKITRESIKKWIKETWKIYVNHELLEAYLRKWYISNNEMISWIESYIYVTALSAIEIIQSPLFAWSNSGWKILIHDYHDLDHDLSSEYQTCLAYAIEKWWLEWREMKIITDTLSLWWDTLEYFIKQHFNNFLAPEILNKLLFNKKSQYAN